MILLNRLNGISQSTGEYLAFLNSDDLWLPDKLKKQIARIIANNMEAYYKESLAYNYRSLINH